MNATTGVADERNRVADERSRVAVMPGAVVVAVPGERRIVTDEEVMKADVRTPTDEVAMKADARMSTEEVVTKADAKTPTDEEVMKADARTPTDEVVTKADVRIPTAEVVMKAEEKTSTKEVAMKVDARIPTDEEVMKADVRTPTEEVAMKEDVKTPIDEVVMKAEGTTGLEVVPEGMKKTGLDVAKEKEEERMKELGVAAKVAAQTKDVALVRRDAVPVNAVVTFGPAVVPDPLVKLRKTEAEMNAVRSAVVPMNAVTSVVVARKNAVVVASHVRNENLLRQRRTEPLAHLPRLLARLLRMMVGARFKAASLALVAASKAISLTLF